METTATTISNKALNADFQFIEVKDGGDGARCPHCGADGRWIYSWRVGDRKFAAMAGCFDLLTKNANFDEIQKSIITAKTKEVKKQKLSGWDKTILKMLQFKEEGKYPNEWCDKKISEAVNQKRDYITSKFRRS